MKKVKRMSVTETKNSKFYKGKKEYFLFAELTDFSTREYFFNHASELPQYIQAAFKDKSVEAF